jgi:acetoin utilization deacetylase AcuC-like enzyme
MKIGYVYDPIYLEHETGDHPENSRRLISVMSHLERTEMLDKLILLQPRPASQSELESTHTANYISEIKASSKNGGGWLDPDTIVSSRSYDAALYAAGGFINAIDSVCSRKVDKAFALVRPPGHHAIEDQAMGFCIFNNIAIGANYALNKLGMDRILIVDFDVHHGNGTQRTFYNNSEVFYFSTHQYPFFPGTGSIEETGNGKGKGYTLNFPMKAGWGDEEYIKIFNEILVPAARRFQPKIILVSAGFDCHWADRLAMIQVSLTGLVQLISVLRNLADELCEGRLVFTLEGGYNLQVIAASVKATFDILSGNDIIDDPFGKSPVGDHNGFEEQFTLLKSLHGLS